MEGMFYYFNDRIVPAGEAKVTVRDISVLRGFGIFDFFRTSRGKPFLIDEYILRFTNSARLIDLPFKYSPDKLKEITLETLQANRLSEAGIRLILTGGDSPNAFLPADPNFAILIEELHWPDEDWFKKGVKLITYPYQREFSQIKTINYIPAIMLQKKAREADAVDILYHHDGEIREVTRSNFFLIKDGRISTPGHHILFGITRKKTIELASMFWPVEERTVRFDEIREADECFMTGTTKKISPVVNIDGKDIGMGEPGPITRRLMKIFEEFEASC